MKHKVLIVSPNFPPVNTPDHQRVRMSLPYYEEFGWEPFVLAVRPEEVEDVLDPLLERTVPEHIPVIRTDALPIKYTRCIGLGDLGLRCLPYLLKAGNRLLSKKKFDLVFFSTTMFITMSLGPYWKKRFGVPYVLDFQDPWLSNYYDLNKSVLPPGGRFKYGISQFIAHFLEPHVLRYVNHVISVSPAYVEMLSKRYSWLKPDQFTVLPFGASEADFTYLQQHPVENRYFNPNDGNQHWVYVGRGGNDMKTALRAFFKALKEVREREPEKVEGIRLHFLGTDYTSPITNCKTVEPIAAEYGLSHLVKERPQRITYFEGLQCLMDAAVLVVPGSDDPGYSPSKIYSYILARKPLLAILHEKSLVAEVLRTTKSGKVITFAGGATLDEIAHDIKNHWFGAYPLTIPNTDWLLFKSYTSQEMARRQCAVFNLACLSTD